MGILDRLFGHQGPSDSRDAQRTSGASPDDQALERYRYLVRTAPPEAIEEAHREAFERLTPEQRQQVLRELSAAAPPNERIADPARADPQTLARMATRAELRQPGTVERTLGGGPGLGGMFASSLLGSVVGSVIGSTIAHQLLGGFHHEAAAADGASSDEVASDDADAAESDGGDVGDDLGGGLGDDG